MVKFGFFEKSTIAVPSLDSDSRVLVTDGHNDHILLLNTELQLLPWCLQLVDETAIERITGDLLVCTEKTESKFGMDKRTVSVFLYATRQSPVSEKQDTRNSPDKTRSYSQHGMVNMVNMSSKWSGKSLHVSRLHGLPQGRHLGPKAKSSEWVSE